MFYKEWLVLYCSVSILGHFWSLLRPSYLITLVTFRLALKLLWIIIKTFLTFGVINFKKQHSSTLTSWDHELMFLLMHQSPKGYYIYCNIFWSKTSEGLFCSRFAESLINRSGIIDIYLLQTQVKFFLATKTPEDTIKITGFYMRWRMMSDFAYDSCIHDINVIPMRHVTFSTVLLKGTSAGRGSGRELWCVRSTG